MSSVTKTTELNSTYFQAYTIKTQKLFSYDPYVAKLPKFFSMTNLFRTIITLGLHLLAYPIAYIRDFWKARQAQHQARQNAIKTLKQDVVQTPLPIRALAIRLLTQERAPSIQARVAAEVATSNPDLVTIVKQAEPTAFITSEDYEQTASTLDLTKGVDLFANRIAEDGTKTLFLEMASQRLPQQLRNEALTYVKTTYGSQYTLGKETIDDVIDSENQIITIRRTIKLEFNGLVMGSVTITGLFNCRDQKGWHHITANLDSQKV